jgi:hypothetical protein
METPVDVDASDVDIAAWTAAHNIGPEETDSIPDPADVLDLNQEADA